MMESKRPSCRTRPLGDCDVGFDLAIGVVLIQELNLVLIREDATSQPIFWNIVILSPSQAQDRLREESCQHCP
jgi:hypothetical protein